MTREIGDILIQQTVDSDYEIERKVRIIEKIEKLVMASLNLAATVAERKADQITRKEEAKEMIQNGASVRETQEATGLSYRQTAKISQEVHKQEKAENEKPIIVRPTRTTKSTDNISDNISDNSTDNINDNEDVHKKQEDKPVLEVATYSVEDEKMVAMKRLAGLTGLKRAAMAAAIKRYFEDKKTFDDAYKDDPAMKFAYTLDDYINGARYNIGS